MSPRYSTTGVILGDPAPGRSAQDRLKTTAPDQTTSSVDEELGSPVTIPWAPKKPTTYQTRRPRSPDLRPIRAIELKREPRAPATDKPVLEWLPPSHLVVDEAYQRSLSPQSFKRIERMATNWDWRRCKAVVVAWSDAGYEILDGQHTAIAAASAGIPAIPVLLIVATTKEQRAAAFIGHNTDQVRVAPTALFYAECEAGDDFSSAVFSACAAAGVTVVKSPFGDYRYKPGETVAIEALKKLVGRREVTGATSILQVLVKAECAPVSSDQIKAAEYLLTDPEHAAEVDVDGLVKAIKATADTAEKDAKLRAAELQVSRWHGLAVVWRQAVRKRRKA